MNKKFKLAVGTALLAIAIIAAVFSSPLWYPGKNAPLSPETSLKEEPAPTPGTGNVREGGRKITIGVSMLGLNEFPSTIAKKMEQEAAEKGANIIIHDGKDSVEKQISDVEALIAKNVDAIILNPVDADKSIICVDLAEKAGIPILGVNAVVSSDKLLTYVGSNDLEAGEIEMKFIAEKLKGEGNIVVMDGVTGQSTQIQRSQGILNILRGYPHINILEEESGNWFRDEGYKLMKKWYEKYGNKIHAVVSQNDEMALGAIRYFEEMGLLGSIPIIGIDAIPDAVQAVQAGKLDATVFQDAEGQGKLAVDLAIKIIKKESVARTYYIPFRLVTKENASEYVPK